MALIELPDARAAVLAAVAPLQAEAVPIDAALGRVLAEDVSAHEPVPGFDASAMDGFAVRAANVAGATPQAPTRLRVVAESRAGAPADVALADGEAISISTGAMLPQGADAIVRVEDTRRSDGAVELLTAVPAGWDVRRAGEDLRAGETVLRAGASIGPAAIGVLASLGRTDVRCARRPRLGLLFTGDELIGPQEATRPGAVRDSNSHALAALARCYGAEVAAIAKAPDDASQTQRLIAETSEHVDVLVICGGMSVGAHDHARPSLAALGAQQAFWGLALKPGKPTWFGTLDGRLTFGLPGNPVSAMVTFALLAGGAMRALQGARVAPERETAIVDRDYEKSGDRAHALRCRLRAEHDGWHAEPTGPQGSHILTSMLHADALLLVPTRTTRVDAGTRLEIERLPFREGAFA